MLFYRGKYSLIKERVFSMKKRIILGIIALAAAMFLTACSNKPDPNNGETVTNQTTQTEIGQSESAIEYAEPDASEFKYSYDAELGGMRITGYNGSSEAIRIPAELDGEPVRKFVINNNKNITHIEVPDGITEINRLAFYGCEKLESAVIPDSVETIGENAFNSCKSLKSITIPDSVKVIDSYAFSKSGLEEITLPDNGVEVYNYAFSGCEDLESITIPDSTKFVAHNDIGGIIDECMIGTFQNCKKLTSIVLPDGIAYIIEAFDGCESLVDVTIPDGVRRIEDYAFSDCKSLESVTLPDSVELIFPYAFAGCESLTSINIPDSVRHIYPNAFADCTSLESLILPDGGGIRGVGDGAFKGCEALTVTYKGKEYSYADLDDLYDRNLQLI